MTEYNKYIWLYKIELFTYSYSETTYLHYVIDFFNVVYILGLFI